MCHWPARSLQEGELTKAGESGKAARFPVAAGSLTILEQGPPLVAGGGTAVAPGGRFWNLAKPPATEDYLKQFFVKNIVSSETDFIFASPFFFYFNFFSCQIYEREKEKLRE